MKSQRYLKPRNTHYNYHQVILYKGGKAYPKYIHRLVARAFISNPSNLKTVDHINFNVTDNRVKNLRWMCYNENSKRQQTNNIVIETFNNEICMSHLSQHNVPKFDARNFHRYKHKFVSGFEITRGKNKGRHFKILGGTKL